jgi:hypothetical protein
MRRLLPLGVLLAACGGPEISPLPSTANKPCAANTDCDGLSCERTPSGSFCEALATQVPGGGRFVCPSAMTTLVYFNLTATDGRVTASTQVTPFFCVPLCVTDTDCMWGAHCNSGGACIPTTD